MRSQFRISVAKFNITFPRYFVFALYIAGLTGLSATYSSNSYASGTSDTPPHILIILADDLGWNDVGYHGSEISTPNIDRIAREGVELDRFYAQPTCSPTRAALMTGKSPKRLGINRPISANQVIGLPLTEKLLPEYLNDAGYRSVMVGKWHLGHHTPDYLPNQRGFEYFYGYANGGVGYWDHNSFGAHDWQRNGKTVREQGYATRLLVNDALRLIDNHHASQPLFLYLALGAPHLPNEAPEATIAKYSQIPNEKRRIHAAMVDELDQGIGRVLAALQDKEMLVNTLIIFASDNGGLIHGGADNIGRTIAEVGTFFFDRPIPIPLVEFMAVNTYDGASDNTPLAGTKGETYEGAVRVPAAVLWPKKLAARKHSGFVTVSDLLPTLLDAALENTTDTSLSPTKDTVGDTGGFDGTSQWQALVSGQQIATPDYYVSGLLNGLALYRWPWKLAIKDDSTLLYNVEMDPLEKNEVSKQHPEIVKAMSSTAHSWPSGPSNVESIWTRLMDGFGGDKGHMPWAESAIENAASAAESEVVPDVKTPL